MAVRRIVGRGVVDMGFFSNITVIPIAATAVWQPVRRIWLCVSSVKTTPAKTELSLSNIDSAHFTKDEFDPSNDLKVSLRIRPQKAMRRLIIRTSVT